MYFAPVHRNSLKNIGIPLHVHPHMYQYSCGSESLSKCQQFTMYADAFPFMPTPIHAVAVSGAILLLMQNMRVEQL